jgi:hypothetical protein
MRLTSTQRQSLVTRQQSGQQFVSTQGASRLKAQASFGVTAVLVE